MMLLSSSFVTAQYRSISPIFSPLKRSSPRRSTSPASTSAMLGSPAIRSAFTLVEFDQLHAVVTFRGATLARATDQCYRRRRADHNAAYGFVHATQLAHHPTDIFGGGDEETLRHPPRSRCGLPARLAHPAGISPPRASRRWAYVAPDFLQFVAYQGVRHGRLWTATSGSLCRRQARAPAATPEIRSA